MEPHYECITRSGNRPAAGATVTVRKQSDGTLATIYSDDGVTVQANPITAGSDGCFQFFAADGRYDVTISGNGIVTKTYSVLLEDQISSYAAVDAKATAAQSAAAAAQAAAEANAQAALDAQAGAEAARDAAIIQAGVYVDEPTGRAAVADGQAFKVQGSGDVAAYEYRRTSASASTLIATYPSASAVAANKDAIGSSVASKNLYNLKTRIAATSVSGTTGALTSNSLWNTSQLISVLPSTQYVANQGQWLLAQYRADSTFISRTDYQSPTSGDKLFTTHAEAAFIRAQVANTAKSFQIEKAAASTAYEPYGYTSTQLRHDADAKRPVSVSVTRDGNGRVSTLSELAGATTKTTTIVRTSGVVTRIDVDDGVYIEQTTINRDGSGKFTGTSKTISEK